MLFSTSPTKSPLPAEFLDWQVRLRRWTAEARDGAPHIGVAPILLVKRARLGPGASGHSIVCGILPAARHLEKRTEEFRRLYESRHGQGARAIYDAGIDYLKGYYESAEHFDESSLTTLLPSDAPVVDAIRGQSRCALVFHVFETQNENAEGGIRCLQVNCRAEILSSGPVYENVWWHNAVFHGAVTDHVVLHFHHESTFDTRFGNLEAMK
jgi:hypothetical protein